MTRRRIPLLVLVTTMVTLSTGACSSGADESSDADVDRQAFGGRSVEMCISPQVGANLGPMTVTFRGAKPPPSNELDAAPVPESKRSPNEGPFRLNTVWCRTSFDPRGIYVTDASGKNVLEVIGVNPSGWYPYVRVKSLTDGTDEEHSFSEGESYTFNAGGYAVEVKRYEDSSDLKNFRIWVGRS